MADIEIECFHLYGPIGRFIDDCGRSLVGATHCTLCGDKIKGKIWVSSEVVQDAHRELEAEIVGKIKVGRFFKDAI